MSNPFEPATEYKFYGVDGNYFKINNKVIEAVEDPSDGYRSCMGSVEVREDDLGLTFFRRPLDRVTIVEADEGSFDGYVLISVIDGHEWLRFGTDQADDWYPCFTFNYQPRVKP